MRIFFPWLGSLHRLLWLPIKFVDFFCFTDIIRHFPSFLRYFFLCHCCNSWINRQLKILCNSYFFFWFFLLTIFLKLHFKNKQLLTTNAKMLTFCIFVSLFWKLRQNHNKHTFFFTKNLCKMCDARTLYVLTFSTWICVGFLMFVIWKEKWSFCGKMSVLCRGYTRCKS